MTSPEFLSVTKLLATVMIMGSMTLSGTNRAVVMFHRLSKREKTKLPLEGQADARPGQSRARSL